MVADYTIDPDATPRSGTPTSSSVRWETRPPLTVGSRLAFVAHFLGRPLTYTYEVVDLQPRQRLVMRTAQGPFAMETTYTWPREGESATRMSLRNHGEPSGFTGIAAPAMTLAMRRANTKDLAALKGLLESGSVPALLEIRDYALQAAIIVARIGIRTLPSAPAYLPSRSCVSVRIRS